MTKCRAMYTEDGRAVLVAGLSTPGSPPLSVDRAVQHGLAAGRSGQRRAGSQGARGRPAGPLDHGNRSTRASCRVKGQWGAGGDWAEQGALAGAALPMNPGL